MVTIKCTRKLLKLLGGITTEEPPAPTGVLGDWYANMIPTVAGELVVLANERTLLSVAFPLEMIDDFFTIFAARVYNLLMMLDVAESVALRESEELRQVELAKTASRSILGSLNDICYQYQAIAEYHSEGKPLSLSEAELKLSRTPHKPLEYEYPIKMAKRLLAEYYG